VKPIRSELTTLFFAALIAGCASSGRSTPALRPHPDPAALRFAELDFEPPSTERVVLPNGVVLHLLHSDRLPLIDLDLRFRAGAEYEPQGLTGLAAITGDLLRTGGTESMPADEIDDRLDDLAANLSLHIDEDSGIGSLNVHRKNFEPALEILAQMLTRPAFDPARLSEAKAREKDEIRRQNDYPISVGFREFFKLLQGADHPSARTPSFATIGRIERADVVAYHERYVRPDHAIIGVSGAFDRDRIEDQIMHALSGWRRSEEPVAAPRRRSAVDRSVQALAAKEVSQSTVIVGHFLVDETHPDRYALQMLNTVLGGGGFVSRLMTEIRNNRGLAYSTGSFMDFGLSYHGYFAAYAMTKAAATAEVLGLLGSEIERLRTGGVTRDEFELARNMMLNGIVFRFDSPAKIVGRAVHHEHYGLPRDHGARALERIAAVTLDDLTRVAREHLKPDSLHVMVVGDPGTFAAPLEGDWTEVELEDPVEGG